MKTKGYFLLIVLCLGTFNGAYSQKLISNAYLKQQVEVFLPNGSKIKSELEIRIKDLQIRTESHQGPMTNILLYSDTSGKLTQLIDMNGKKQGKISTPDFKTANEFQVEYLDESKTVLEFKCKKAVLKTVVDNKVTEERVVWYTKEIKLPFPYDFGIPGLYKIDGFPMEYENLSNGIKMIHKVVELDLNRKIEDSLFVIPDGYEFK